jgi:hypothetical protein
MDMVKVTGAYFPQEGGVEGELFIYVNPMSLSKMFILYEPSIFLLSVPKPQSLNTCKESWCEESLHIVIESMGLSTINVKECESQFVCIKGKFECVF